MKDKAKNHPLEDLLEIEEHSTPNPFGDLEEETRDLVEDDDEEKIDDSVERAMANLPKPLKDTFYDEIDKENASKFDTIHGFALDAYSKQIQEAGLVDTRFRARNYEVAAQFLRLALDGAKDSANQKANKDKIKIAEQKATVGPSKGNTNIFVGDTNELMKQLRAAKEEQKKTTVIEHDDS